MFPKGMFAPTLRFCNQLMSVRPSSTLSTQFCMVTAVHISVDRRIGKLQKVYKERRGAMVMFCSC